MGRAATAASNVGLLTVLWQDGGPRWESRGRLLLVLAGLLPWQWFANGVLQSSQSVTTSGNLIDKVYFPRLVVPMAALGGPPVDFTVAAVVAVPWLAFRGLGWHASQWLVPVFALGIVLVTLGVGLGLSALIAEFRDFRHVTGFLLQFWLFCSPIAYPLSINHCRRLGSRMYAGRFPGVVRPLLDGESGPVSPGG